MTAAAALQRHTFEIRLYGETELLTRWRTQAIARYRTLVRSGYAQGDVQCLEFCPNETGCCGGGVYERAYPATPRMYQRGVVVLDNPDGLTSRVLPCVDWRPA